MPLRFRVPNPTRSYSSLRWNEEENLPAVLDELHDRAARTQTSSSSTTARPTEPPASRATHGAQVLSFGENRGLREGIAAGYAYADEHGYEYVGRVDADGQHPVEELARLLAIVRAGEATSLSARASPPATGTRRFATSRRRADGWAPRFCDARCAWRSGTRSTTRRAGCTP